METLIVGFGYKARNGKDTAVQAILDARRDKFDVRRYSFASALKREVNEAADKCGGMLGLITRLQLGGVIPELGFRLNNGLPSWVTYEPDAPVDAENPYGKQRTLLQWWGTELRRKLDPFYWVRALDKQITADKPGIALISDVRFLNEVFWVKHYAGDTVKVVRYGYDDILASSHASENELTNYLFDYEISVLDGEVEQLKKDAVTVFDLIVEERTLPSYKPEDFGHEVAAS
jgi:hypothetical protein